MIRAYRVRVHKPGTTNPTDATVDFTLGMSHLVDPPVLPSPIVKPAHGRTETVAWALRVLDTDGAVTSHLADPATGRAWLVGRIIDVQLEDGGSPWRTLGIGRLAYISEPDGPGEYTIRVEDERWLERRAPAFAHGDTTMLYPPGIRNGALWRGRPGNWDQAGAVERVKVEGSFVRVRFPRRFDLLPITRFWIENDLVTRPLRRRSDGEGNFRFLRLQNVVAGTYYPVITFDDLDSEAFTVSLGEYDREDAPKLTLWVWAPGGLPASFAGGLFAPDAPPSPATPVHTGTMVFGGAAQPHYGARNLWDLAKVLHEDAGVRIDPAAFDSLPKTLVQFPVTEDLSLADWLERYAYQPEGVVPFVDNEGRVAPRLVRLPQDVDPNALFLFDASNLDAPVQWHMGRQDMITQIRFRTLATIGHGPGDQRDPVTGTQLRDWDQSGDGVHYAPHEEVRTTEPASGAPVGDELEVFLHGYEARHVLAGMHTGAWDKIDVVERDIFERYADGPQTGTLYGLLSTESVEPGDLVVIDCDALQMPNAATNARTGHRIVQIMQRVVHPDAYEHHFLDVGPKLQPLVAPTLAIAKDATNPRHGVTLTISSLPAGAVARVELAYDSAFAEVVRVVDGLGAGAHQVGELASGRTVYARPMSTAPERVRSRWGTTRSVALDVIPAPTALTASDITRSTARLSWTPGSANYGVEVLVVEGGAPAQWTDDHAVGRLDAGSIERTIGGLRGPAVAHTAAVRHFDRYGGVSGVATRALTTTTVVPTLPRPAGITTVHSTSPPRTLSQLIRLRFGVVVGLYASPAGYDFEIQRAPDQGGSPHPDPGTYELLGPVPATQETYTDILPSDGAYRHYRIRHVADGEEPSAWTCWVRDRPSPIVPPGPGRADPVLPVVRERALFTGDQWQAVLTISDPQCRVTEVAVDVGSGYAPVAGVDGVYTSPSVTRTTQIRARVTGYDAAGHLGVLLERDFGEGGAKGEPGASAEARYSGPNPGQNVSAIFDSTKHLYIQVRQSGEDWPDDWIRIVGESGDDGTDGVYTEYRFRAAASKPAKPTDATWTSQWSDAPPAYDPATQRLYLAFVVRDSRTGARISDYTDPVQISGPEGPQGPPGPGVTDPRITLTLLRTRAEEQDWLITATTWSGSTAGLQWRHRYYTADTPASLQPGWPEWPTSALPAAGVEVTIPRHDALSMILAVQVRESAETSRVANATASLPPWDTQTKTGSKIDADGARDAAVNIAGEYTDLQASDARSGAYSDAITEVEGRGLHGDGYEGFIGRGTGGIDTSTAIDGVGRARTGLTPAGTLLTGLEPSAVVGGGLTAETVGAQVREPSSNLCGPNAGAEASSLFGNIKVEVVNLAAAGLTAGVDVVSCGVEVAAPNNAANRARIDIYFRDSSGNNIDAVSYQVTGAAFTLRKDEALTIPAGTHDIFYRVWNTDGVVPVHARRMQINRGPILLSFDLPPGRPGRDDIDIWRGALNREVKKSDGARLLAITAGMRVYEARHGATNIVFDPPYQDAPVVLVFGPKTYSATLGAGADQYALWTADQVTSGGIGRVIMQLEALSGIAWPSDPLAGGTLTAQGHASAIPGGLTAKAVNGRYEARYGVALSCTAAPGLGQTTVSIIVAADTLKSGIWTERVTAPYSITAASGGSNSLDLPSESLTAVVSNLVAGDNVRVRIKSATVEHMAGTGSASIAVYPGSITYATASAVRDPGDAPGEWGEPGRVLVLGAT